MTFLHPLNRALSWHLTMNFDNFSVTLHARPYDWCRGWCHVSVIVLASLPLSTTSEHTCTFEIHPESVIWTGIYCIYNCDDLWSRMLTPFPEQDCLIKALLYSFCKKGTGKKLHHFNTTAYNVETLMGDKGNKCLIPPPSRSPVWSLGLPNPERENW